MEVHGAAWRMYDALVGERDRWLLLWDDERTPAVTESVANDRVVLAPWVDEEINDVTVVITTEGLGSKLTVFIACRPRTLGGRT